MEKNQVKTVKIYFIDPIEIISVVINALIELEFESYSVSKEDTEKLLTILPDNIRNVIFFCINSKRDIDYWLAYVEKLQKIANTHNIIGAFVSDNIGNDIRNQFLTNSVALINISELKKDTLGVLKKILMFFEAKGKRAFIRVKTFGENQAYFYMKGKEEPIIGKVLNISAFAFLCEIQEIYKDFFDINMYVDEVVLVLRGMRIKCSVKVMGFNKDHNQLFIFKFCQSKFENDKMVYIESNNPENNRKLHEYIRKCLKMELTEKFEAMDEEENGKK
ncbi:MAG: hypothetical protein MJB14_10760, partial [Spirochaetes bacterium]|nr:hypothetical protein [Spirochaetota bacterium]